MRFKKSAVVGVLITVYLSTDSLCHYIPEKKQWLSKKNESAGSHGKSDRIQICGNALTTLIIEACDGIVGSLYQANSSKDSVQTKITEDCCDQECPLDYLQNYCGDIPLFTIKKTLRGELLNKFNRNRPTAPGTETAARGSQKKKTTSAEVRVKERKHLKRNWGKRRKKRKRSFKWKCAYRSFGHYLLKLDRDVRGRNNMEKRQNSVNRSWPSIQIGTISPEIDKFGGQPIVVVKKNKSNTV